MAMAEKKIFPREQGNCSCKTPSSEMGQPIVLCSSAVWTKPARKKGEKNRTWSIAKPIFFGTKCTFCEVPGGEMEHSIVWCTNTAWAEPAQGKV